MLVYYANKIRDVAVAVRYTAYEHQKLFTVIDESQISIITRADQSRIK